MKKLNNLTKKDILSKVDDFIKELNYTPEILGLRTENEKILYYFNYLDYNNMFRESDIKFPNRFFIKLANFLCKSEERLQEYLNKFHDNEDTAHGINKFRKHLRSNRGDIEAHKFLKEISQQIKAKQWSDLHSTLQELFLEPFHWFIMESIVEMIENGLATEDLYNWYAKGRNITSIVTFSVDYVKSR
jgi:hypothetical protein